jgi:putative membrane protein
MTTTLAPASIAREAASCSPLALLAVGAVLLVVSGIQPYDRVTWWLEIAPCLIVVPVLAASYARFPLTPLLYQLILLHAAILMLGGHYTYSRVPLGFWVADAFGFARNHYDRLGHFVQGFVPAIAAREVLLRRTRLTRGPMLFTLVTCVCLAVSASYEILEWWVAVASGSAADAFLGTQGDPWDTQWDMLMALVGALTAQLLLGRIHDRALARVGKNPLARLQDRPGPA